MFKEYAGADGSAFFQKPCDGLSSEPSAGILPKGRLKTTINPIVIMALSINGKMRIGSSIVFKQGKRVCVLAMNSLFFHSHMLHFFYDASSRNAIDQCIDDYPPSVCDHLF